MEVLGTQHTLVDGATMNMPDTAKNQQVYPQLSTQKKGLGFPLFLLLGRMVALISLETGALINGSISAYSGKQTGETSLLRNILDSLNKGDLLLGDSLYSTTFILAELHRREIDFLFEQNGPRQRTTDFTSGEKLGSRDHIINKR